MEIPDKPYDVLVHQIAGLMLKTRRLAFSEVLELARNAAPLPEFDFGRFAKAFKYMHERFPRLAWVALKTKLP